MASVLSTVWCFRYRGFPAPHGGTRKTRGSSPQKACLYDCGADAAHDLRPRSVPASLFLPFPCIDANRSLFLLFMPDQQPCPMEQGVVAVPYGKEPVRLLFVLVHEESGALAHAIASCRPFPNPQPRAAVPPYAFRGACIKVVPASLFRHAHCISYPSRFRSTVQYILSGRSSIPRGKNAFSLRQCVSVHHDADRRALPAVALAFGNAAGGYPEGYVHQRLQHDPIPRF